MATDLELKFLFVWKSLGGPPMETQHRFAKPRRWRFDFALTEAKIAFEVEGGTWSGKGHVRGKNYTNDCEKYNTAQLQGWQVYRWTTDMLREPVKFGMEDQIKHARSRL